MRAQPGIPVGLLSEGQQQPRNKFVVVSLPAPAVSLITRLRTCCATEDLGSGGRARQMCALRLPAIARRLTIDFANPP
jgi:hypothetical protein